MQGLGGLLCLATVAIEALLSVMAAALSGFGLFFRVSFRWGHDDLLRIVMSSIPTYMKETMSHLASISKRQTRGEDAPAPPSYKPFMMNGFHGVSSENPHQCLLKFMFGKARIVSNPLLLKSRHMKGLKDGEYRVYVRITDRRGHPTAIIENLRIEGKEISRIPELSIYQEESFKRDAA